MPQTCPQHRMILGPRLLPHKAESGVVFCLATLNERTLKGEFMLRRHFITAATACALGVSLQAQALSPAVPEPLNFGIISTESSANLKSAWQPVLEDMGRALDRPIKPFFASDYAGIVEAMRFNKVQIAWYGNQSAMEAVDRANGDVFASVVSASGDPGYWSLLIANKDSPLNSVADVLANSKNLSFGAGDPNSTSGTAVPGYYLWAQNGVDPRQIFKSVRSANHEANLLAVLNKQVDVSTIMSEALDRYKQNTGKDAAESIKILWTSPLIASDPLVIRNDLPTSIQNGVRVFFLNYGKGEGPQAQRERDNLAALGYSGFKASSNAQLIPFRQLALAKKKADTERNAALNEDQKRQEIAAIDSQLQALDAAMKSTAQ